VEYSSLLWILDIAPLAPLHSLIITKRHVPAFSYVVGELWEQLRALLSTVTRTLETLTGQTITVFEHGVTCCSIKGGCCIEHAHLHAVPCASDVSSRVEADGLRVVSEGSGMEKWQASLSGLPDAWFPLIHVWWSTGMSIGVVIVGPR
jgi:diadenosine tetraphosphate (Ap4A) HIT family hydrolase